MKEEGNAFPVCQNSGLCRTLGKFFDCHQREPNLTQDLTEDGSGIEEIHLRIIHRLRNARRGSGRGFDLVLCQYTRALHGEGGSKIVQNGGTDFMSPVSLVFHNILTV